MSWRYVFAPRPLFEIAKRIHEPVCLFMEGSLVMGEGDQGLAPKSCRTFRAGLPQPVATRPPSLNPTHLYVISDVMAQVSYCIGWNFFETFIDSTFGLKPSSSTDINFTKPAIMTNEEQLSVSLESEKPQPLPLAPPLPLTSSCWLSVPLDLQQIGFPQAGSTQLPPETLGRY